MRHKTFFICSKSNDAANADCDISNQATKLIFIIESLYPFKYLTLQFVSCYFQHYVPPSRKLLLKMT